MIAALRLPCLQGIHPGGGDEPQEIDGKSSENLLLCRNRDAAGKPRQLSRKTSPDVSLNRAASHRLDDITTK